uniref:HTH_48 domain-containing protein n=1 Tax=Trichuris muris TaxID=70415 RepID=A0A5S6Q1Y9_TRIMR
MRRKASEAVRHINQAFGQGTIINRTAQRWFKRFRTGDESLEDMEPGRRFSKVDDDELRAVIEADPRKTTREVAKQLNVSQPTIVTHLNKIGKSEKLDKWVPHELNESQRMRRYEVCSALVLRNKNEPFLDRIVTCDEKWILYDNRKRSAQWLDRGAAPKQFPKPNQHQRKVMVSVWWSRRGLISYTFFKPGETITAEKYCHEIEKMHEQLQGRYPILVNRKGPILLHDNARPHVSQRTIQKLHDLGYETLPHPACSPDLSPTEYHFFKHLDRFLQGKVFKNEEEAENAFEEFVASRTP